MRALLTSPLGFLIGLTLGAVGGGGSILAVPALVYAAGQDPKAATTTSLVIVGLVALSGLPAHHRAGRVRWVPGMVFGATGIAGSIVGSHLNDLVDPEVLLIAFAALMIVAAFAMCRRNPSSTGFASCLLPARERDVLDAAPARPLGGTAVGAPPRPTTTITPAIAAKVALAGTIVGALTGFFGVGGGFVVVPALVLALRFAMPDAVGTSLVVITINAAVALTVRARTHGNLEWDVIVPYTVAGMAGMFTGSRLADRVDPSTLSRWFVRLLVAVALYTGIRSILAL